MNLNLTTASAHASAALHDLQVAFDIKSDTTRSIVTAVVILLGSFLLKHVYTYGFTLPDKSTIPPLTGLPLRNAWLFFTKRYDFINAGFDRMKQDLYQFKVNQHKIVVMRGEASRKLFYNNKDLAFDDGYMILIGGAPRVQDLKVETNHADDLSWFQRKVILMLRKERLVELLPEFFSDLERRMAVWPDEGIMNPFENVYDLVFQITARAATCREIADSPALTSKVAKLYWTIEKGSNARAMVFPWLPNRAVRDKQVATEELYAMLSGFIEKRKETGAQNHDALQVLIDAGDTTADIVAFVLFTLFAGVINTGNNACWILLFLAGNPTWRSKALTEIRSLITKYAPESSSGSSSSSSTSAKKAKSSVTSILSLIPPSAWDDEMPVMEDIIRECIRIILSTATLRRNVKEDLFVDGKRIERGAFMAMPLSSVHLNPEIYTNPSEFDPGRYGEGREEDKKVMYGYIGWGVGRHPCLGMKFAKLELKVIVATFLVGFEYEHVDGQGRRARVSASDIDRNDIIQARPLGEPPYLKFRRVKA